MHFVLVHGAYHGAWCWDELRTELERGGHSSTAVELPIEDPDAGAERYVDEVLQAVPRHADAVVMVGHSLAGLTIPIAASRTRTAMTIYLCALLPVPGLSWDAQRAGFGTGFEPSEPAVEREDGRRAARLQLGIDPIELPGGHSPFLSRPRDLAQTLVRAASR